MSGYRSNLILGVRIGGGHFGDVHSGQDDVHGNVAVKVLRQHLGESAGDWATRKASLLKEAQHLSQAAHANVVQVHGLLESSTDDAILMVMAHCAGGSLQPAFDAGPMLLAEVRRISTDICLGLGALHSRGMLHRDIKPGNILLTAENVSQLGDFGLVTDDLILGYGSQAGYSDHIAIEVWNGGGTSIKSDIWALGMTIYRLLHGSQWYSELPADPQDIIRDGGFAASLPWLPHIPDRWRRTVRKMMHDNAVHRYQSTDQVMSALAQLPIYPSWSCQVEPHEILWKRETEKRRINVVRTRHSPTQHEWRAWSEPIGNGQNRTLGGSAGIIKRSQVEKQLKAFFDS
jgi:eukaryotic-like serine/threonine-protein kinase